MLELHPEIMENDGKKFAVIPYQEYLEVERILSGLRSYAEPVSCLAEIMKEIDHRG